MFDEAWVEVSGGNLVRLPELSARLAVGEKGPVSLGAHSTHFRDIHSVTGYLATADVNGARDFWVPSG